MSGYPVFKSPTKRLSKRLNILKFCVFGCLVFKQYGTTAWYWRYMCLQDNLRFVA